MEYIEKTNHAPQKYKNILSHNINQRYYTHRNLLSLKKLIFPPISNEKINQLMIDDESIKYITFNSSAQDITNIIMNSLFDFPCPKIRNHGKINDTNILHRHQNKWKNKSIDKRMKKLVITEMTAGVGGNVLNFAKYFKYVNAIEIDTTRYNYLNKNIKLYGYNNVNCYNDNSMNLLINQDDIFQDIVFFDPPWGGKDYKLFSNLRLQFGHFSIENVCRILFQRKSNKMIIMKLPNNYDFDYLCGELKDYSVTKFTMDRMTIIVVKNYSSTTE